MLQEQIALLHVKYIEADSTLDTWMLSTEVHTESHLGKAVTKSGDRSNTCLHLH